MKRFILLLVGCLFFIGALAVNTDSITKVFKTGDAALLKGSMDAQVEMILPSVNKKCPASDALRLLTDFFRVYKPTGFTVLHQADKKESGFYIGKLTASEKEFRVNITYRTQNDAIRIQSIRIE